MEVQHPVSWIVVDIDNTIISQGERKRALVKKLFKIELPVERFKKDYSMESIITEISTKYGYDKKDVKRRIEDELFSDRYYDPEYFSPIGQANHYLQRLSKYYNILYLTSRTSDLQQATIATLESLGFPCEPQKTEFSFLPNREMDLDSFEASSQDFKSSTLSRFCIERQVVAGIGDTLADVAAYYENGIQSILLTEHETEESALFHLAKTTKNEVDAFGLMALSSWSEIYEYLLFLSGEENFITKTCKAQISDYSEWLDDLDAKSQLILLVATFCATAVFQSIISGSFKSPMLELLAFCCLFTALMAVFFAIRSFASRVTHGNEGALRILFPKLAREGKKAPKANEVLPRALTPIDERVALYKSHYAKSGCAKYLRDRYGFLDEAEVLSKTLFSMRGANYDKMYPEFRARIMLYITIALMLVLAFLSLTVMVPFTA